MYTTAFIARPSLERKLNGFTYRQSFCHRQVPVEFTKFSADIPIQNRTVSISGDFRLTVAEAKKQVETLCKFTITNKRGQTRVLRDNERPFYRLYSLVEQKLVRLHRQEIRIVPSTGVPSCLTNVRQLNLAKITLDNIFLAHIDLSSLLRLQYVKITNVGLRSIVFGRGVLEYCNLSQNKLSSCHAQAKLLNLSGNRVKVFVSDYNYHFLNLSGNPLHGLSAKAEILDVSRTQLSHPLSVPASKIMADETPSIEFGCCPKLVALHINNCNLKAFPDHLKKIRFLKARNNYFIDLPLLRHLECADLSGNLLTKIPSRSLRYVDMSVNHVEFLNVRDFPSLVSINLEFNPITSDEFFISYNTRLNGELDESLFKILKRPSLVNPTVYHCPKQSRYIMQYNIKMIICDSPVVFYIFHATQQGEDMSSRLGAVFSGRQDEPQPLNLFQDFVTASLRVFAANGSACKCAFVLATKTIVLMESRGIDLVFVNFVEIEKIGAADKVRAFYNTARWHIFPLLCYLRSDALRRCQRLGIGISKIGSIFRYLELYCPLSLEMALLDASLSHTSPSSGSFLAKKIFDKTYNRSFDAVCAEQESTSGRSLSRHLNYQNIDFGIGFHRDFMNYQSTNMGKPVFAFLKFYHPEAEDQPIIAEKRNIMCVIRFFTHIFAGSFVEQNHLCCIVGFNNPISSALWALRLQRILKIDGVDIGVGITEDIMFRTEVDGVVSFGGPTLNKLSRIASLGVGVFISEFINISHPLIKLVDEGYVQFKGFQNAHRVNSIHFRG